MLMHYPVQVQSRVKASLAREGVSLDVSSRQAYSPWLPASTCEYRDGTMKRRDAVQRGMGAGSEWQTATFSITAPRGCECERWVGDTRCPP